MACASSVRHPILMVCGSSIMLSCDSTVRQIILPSICNTVRYSIRIVPCASSLSPFCSTVWCSTLLGTCPILWSSRGMMQRCHFLIALLDSATSGLSCSKRCSLLLHNVLRSIVDLIRNTLMWSRCRPRILRGWNIRMLPVLPIGLAVIDWTHLFVSVMRRPGLLAPCVCVLSTMRSTPSSVVCYIPRPLGFDTTRMGRYVRSGRALLRGVVHMVPCPTIPTLVWLSRGIMSSSSPLHSLLTVGFTVIVLMLWGKCRRAWALDSFVSILPCSFPHVRITLCFSFPKRPWIWSLISRWTIHPLPLGSDVGWTRSLYRLIPGLPSRSIHIVVFKTDPPLSVIRRTT